MVHSNHCHTLVVAYSPRTLGLSFLCPASLFTLLKLTTCRYWRVRTAFGSTLRSWMEQTMDPVVEMRADANVLVRLAIAARVQASLRQIPFSLGMTVIMKRTSALRTVIQHLLLTIWIDSSSVYKSQTSALVVTPAILSLPTTRITCLVTPVSVPSTTRRKSSTVISLFKRWC